MSETNTNPNDSYDYVIIGGGTAGLVVAARLTEQETTSVCVLEAGEDVTHTNEASIPGLASKLWKNDTNWKFTSVPQKYSDDKVIHLVSADESGRRGKGLGGSSMANLMQMNRAPAREYDAFERLGINGWNSAEFLKYFIKSQSLAYTPEGIKELGLEPDERQFGSGPVINTLPRYQTSYDLKWIEALEESGVPYNTNAMGGESIGAWLASVAIHPETATRVSSATAYYEPNKHRKNLTVITGAHVTRIQLDTTSSVERNPVARGVEYLKDGRKYAVSAKKEVILAAGAYQTPQILELSGIGQKNLLDSHGIPTIVDLPGVGQNLRKCLDHPAIIAVFELKSPHESYDILRVDPNRAAAELRKYTEKREGMLTSVPGLYAFLPLDKLDGAQQLRDYVAQKEWNKIQGSILQVQQEWLSDDKVPQVEFISLPYFWPTIPKPERDPGKTYFTATVILLHPFSRGSVHINSPDPFAHPNIDLSVFDNDMDLQAMLKGLKFLRKALTATNAFEEVVEKEVAPGPMGNSDEGLEKYLKTGLTTAFHPIGTAAMVRREDRGVVDERLKVYGVDRLRIVDASVLPFQLGAHIQASVYAVAEKAADLLKEDALCDR